MRSMKRSWSANKAKIEGYAFHEAVMEREQGKNKGISVP
jgi:hypothetical protein